MTSISQRSNPLQSMTSQELAELSQSEHDTLLSKLSSCRILPHSQVRISGLLSILTSPELSWLRYSKTSSTSKTTEQSLPTSNWLNKLMDNDMFRLCRNNSIKRWEQLQEWATTMTSTIKETSPHLQHRLNPVWAFNATLPRMLRLREH